MSFFFWRNNDANTKVKTAELDEADDGRSMTSADDAKNCDNVNENELPMRNLSYRESRFDDILTWDVVDLEDLKKLSWNGIPPNHRPMVWRLLTGYMPANKGRREMTLKRKRGEYRDALGQGFDIAADRRSIHDQSMLRQILVDVPRTSPGVALFRTERLQRSMERVLYTWAMRHPASGYVQGMNDLVTPLYLVFLGEFMPLAIGLQGEVDESELGNKDSEEDDRVVQGSCEEAIEAIEASLPPEDIFNEIEADVYWCLTKLLDNIQDHYTAMQPGLQRMTLRLEDLVRRIDAKLYQHFESEGLQFMQFAFRWTNCLLMRELPPRAIIRAWDSCLSEERGFENFYIYICAALLASFSPQLMGMEFQDLTLFLQNLPTSDWGQHEMEVLLSQAYVLCTLFEDSSAHLNSNG